jgi:hypothetical protein
MKKISNSKTTMPVRQIKKTTKREKDALSTTIHE